MADTLSRIVGPVNMASGLSTVFTGTTAHTYTIKQITVVNNTAADITVKLGIQAVTADPLADADLFLPTATIDAGGMATFDGLLVLSGTEKLRAHTSATGLTISVHGLDQS